MIYIFETLTINTSKSNAWEQLIYAVRNLSEFSGDIMTCTLAEDTNEGFMRITQHNDIGIVEEKVRIYQNIGKISASITKHNLYYGETSYQLIYPETPGLAERKTGVVVMLVWHMHAGLIEAASINKTKYVQNFINKLKQNLEWGTATL